MQGEFVGAIAAKVTVIRPLFSRLRARLLGGDRAQSLLWIDMWISPRSAAAVGVMSLGTDSAVAGEVAMQFQQLAFVADWQSTLLHWLGERASDISGFIGKSYDDAPAMLLGLSLFVTVPLLVVAGLILRRSDLAMEPGRTMKYRAVRKVPIANLVPSTQRLPVLGDASVIIQQAETSEPEQYRFNGALMVRIGREEDNDVRLRDPTVHRYHAVISRSADSGFIISDLSSADGNGVIVNGARVRRQRLNDGDTITLGTAKLTFRLQ